jgi:sporulation protein YlmC with PRC-barrel domain
MEARYTIGSAVSCSDGVCGTLSRVIVDPVGRTLTHLVVEPDSGPDDARLVPVGLVDPAAPAETIALRCDRAQFDGLEYAQVEEYIPAENDGLGYGVQNTLWLPFYPLGGVSAAPLPTPGSHSAFSDLSDAEPRTVTEERVPVGEVQVRRGQSVHATDGDIGRVRGLAVDPATGHVTHVLLDEGHLWGKKTVGIPIDAVEGVQDGIRLNLSKDEVRDLPEVEVGKQGVL